MNEYIKIPKGWLLELIRIYDLYKDKGMAIEYLEGYLSTCKELVKIYEKNN